MMVVTILNLLIKLSNPAANSDKFVKICEDVLSVDCCKAGIDMQVPPFFCTKLRNFWHIRRVFTANCR